MNTWNPIFPLIELTRDIGQFIRDFSIQCREFLIQYRVYVYIISGIGISAAIFEADTTRPGHTQTGLRFQTMFHTHFVICIYYGINTLMSFPSFVDPPIFSYHHHGYMHETSKPSSNTATLPSQTNEVITINTATQLPLKLTPTKFSSWKTHFETLMLSYDGWLVTSQFPRVPLTAHQPTEFMS